jgi:hypothetical protein
MLPTENGSELRADLVRRWPNRLEARALWFAGRSALRLARWLDGLGSDLQMRAYRSEPLPPAEPNPYASPIFANWRDRLIASADYPLDGSMYVTMIRSEPDDPERTGDPE